MKKIRMGLIGCGKMMKSHIAATSSVENVEFTAVCDIDRARAEDVATVLKDTYVTTDYKTMLDYVDAVLVALPHDLHYECGMFFAKHKKHILMEKPLCNTERECKNLIEICEKENVVLMCAYPVRYWPGIVKLKEYVDSGDFGKVIEMSIWTEQNTIVNEDSWLATARIGGGQFFSHGCHYVDVMLWFMGNPIEGAHFGTRIGTPNLLEEGTSAAIFKFESGAIGYHGGTWAAKGSRMRYDFQIQTEKGMLEYDHIKGEVRLYNGETVHIPGTVNGESGYKILWKRESEVDKETQHEIKHFANCVINGTKPLTDARSALKGLQVIWKLYDAEKNHTVADLRGLGL